MTIREKAGMMVINSRGMGIYSKDPDKETGLLDETLKYRRYVFLKFSAYHAHWEQQRLL